MKKLLILLLVGIIAASLWYRRGLQPTATEIQSVTIEKGMGVSAIASELVDAGLIRSTRAFALYTRLHGIEGLLKAGAYRIDPKQGIDGVTEILMGGKSDEARVTIPEGATLSDIDAILAEEGLMPAGAAIECATNCDFSSFEFLPKLTGLADRGGKLEGYLYPDTYFVNPAEFEPKFFLERLLTTFRHRVVEDLAPDIKASGHSLHEIVTMASLVEEETRTEDERAVVSGILWKRLEEKIGLYVDATTRYVLEKQTGTLTVDDLDVDSPYNTRKYWGLPPGPIANSGMQSIKAALHPKGSQYYYYLHGKDGQIRYAITNDEHNANKAKYLR